MGEMGISARGPGFADMVSDSRYSQAFAGALSVPAGRISNGFGLCRLAAGFGGIGGNLPKSQAESLSPALSRGLDISCLERRRALDYP